MVTIGLDYSACHSMNWNFYCQLDLHLFLTATRKFVPRVATASKLEKDVPKSSRSIIVGATGQNIALMNAQTPKVPSLIESKSTFTAPVTSPKEPAADEKKYIVVISQN